jgi:predicted MFS family arabinose efflux permease
VEEREFGTAKCRAGTLGDRVLLYCLWLPGVPAPCIHIQQPGASSARERGLLFEFCHDTRSSRKIAALQAQRFIRDLSIRTEIPDRLTASGMAEDGWRSRLCAALGRDDNSANLPVPNSLLAIRHSLLAIPYSLPLSAVLASGMSRPSPRLSLSPLVIFCLAALSAAMANRAMDPLVAEVAREFDVALATAAGVISIYALAYAFSQPILGPLGDYYGKGRVLRLCMWMLCASLVVVVISPTIGVLMAARFFGGIASAGIMPTGMASVGDLYGPSERQQKIGTYVSVALVGYTFAAAVAGILAVYLSWRAIFAITLAFAILAALLLSRIVEKTPRPDKPISIRDAIGGYKTLFSNPRAKYCYGAVFLEGVGLWGTLPFIAPILEARGEGGAGEAGLIITAMGLGMLLFTSTVKHWLKIASPYQLMFAGGLITGVGPVSLAFHLDWMWFAAIFAVSGFGFMAMHNSIQAEVANLAPSVRGSAFSMHSCWLFVGHSVGPILFTFGQAKVGQAAMLGFYSFILLMIGPMISIALTRTPPPQSG